MSLTPEQAEILRALDFDPSDTSPLECEGSYTCACPRCQREREFLAKRGVRHDNPWPVRTR